MLSKFVPKLIAATAFATVLAVLPAAASSAAPRTLSLGANNNATDFIADGFRFYAKRIGELSNDQLKVEIFWSSQLGGAKEMVQGVAAGSIDMQMDVIDLLVTLEPRLGILNMPLVFRDREHFGHFVGSPIFGSFLDTLASKGVVFPGRKFLGEAQEAINWVRPYDRGIVSKRPIFKPSDLKGFKMRMYESEIPIKSWQQLGASVQVVPWPDVYTALATGTIDGLTGTVTDNYEMKHFENAVYWTDVHEYFQMMHPWMSKMTWDSLTEAQRNAVDQATHEASAVFAKLMKKANDESTQRAQTQYGVTLIYPPIKPWIEKMKPAVADFEKRGLIPKGLVEQIQAIQ